MSAPLQPAVFWLYGLSGAGKTTLANALAAWLRQRGAACLVLDGDAFRSSVSAGLGFSAADRAENIRRAASMAQQACQQGQVVVAAFITPTVALRELARSLVAPLPFYEVYLDCDYATAAGRDPKGLYAQASAGTLKDFTGKDSLFEPPAAEPDLRLNTRDLSPRQCEAQLLAFAGLTIPGCAGEDC